nr:MAG TPA: hypothetical protein [Caudoviricetes sp.]
MHACRVKVLWRHHVTYAYAHIRIHAPSPDILRISGENFFKNFFKKYSKVVYFQKNM